MLRRINTRSGTSEGLCPLLIPGHGADNLAVGEAHVSKRVLQAIAEAHPEDGSFAVRRVDISRGWGNLVNVTIHTEPDRSWTLYDGPEAPSRRGHARAVREAVERALAPERCRVSLLELG